MTDLTVACQDCLFNYKYVSELKQHLSGKAHRKKMAELFQKDEYRGLVSLPSIVTIEAQKDPAVVDPIIGLSLVTMCFNTEMRGVFYLCHVCEERCGMAQILPHLFSADHYTNYYCYTDPDFMSFSWIPNTIAILGKLRLVAFEHVKKNGSGVIQVLDLPMDIFSASKDAIYSKVMHTFNQNEKLSKVLKASKQERLTIQTYQRNPKRNHPLLGLQHLVEFSCNEPFEKRSYLCTICCLKVDGRNIIKHVLGFDHIYWYLKAWHPSILHLTKDCYMVYNSSFSTIMRDAARQADEIHTTAITDIKQVALEPALFRSVDFSCYAKAFAKLESIRNERSESNLTTNIKPGDQLGPTEVDGTTSTAAKVSSTAPTAAKVSSTAPTAAKVSSTAPTAAKVSSTAPAPAKVSSTAPAPAKVSSTAPTAAKVSSTAPTAAKVSSTAPTAAKVSSTAPAAAKVSSTAPTAAKVSSTAPAPAKVSSTAPAPAKVSSTAPAPAKFSSTAPSAAKVSSTAPSAAKVSSTAPAPAKVSSTAPAPAKVSSTAPAPAKVSSTAPTPAEVCSTAPTAAEVSSTAPTAAKVSSTAPTAAKVSSTAPTPAEVSSTAPTAAEVSSTAPTAAEVSSTASAAVPPPLIAEQPLTTDTKLQDHVVHTTCRLHCQDCDLTFSNVFKYNKHVKNWKHRKEVERIFGQDGNNHKEAFLPNLDLYNYLRNPRRTQPVIGLPLTYLTTTLDRCPVHLCFTCEVKCPPSDTIRHLGSPQHLKNTLMYQNPCRLPFAWKDNMDYQVLKTLAWEEERERPDDMILKVYDVSGAGFNMLNNSDTFRNDMDTFEYFDHGFKLAAPKCVPLKRLAESSRYPMLGLRFMVQHSVSRPCFGWGFLCLLCRRKMSRVEFYAHVFSHEHVTKYLAVAHPRSLTCEMEKNTETLLDLAQQAAKLQNTRLTHQVIKLSNPIKEPFTYRKAFHILKLKKKSERSGGLVPHLPARAMKKLVLTEIRKGKTKQENCKMAEETGKQHSSKTETPPPVKSNTTPQIKSETTQPVKSETTQPVKSETTQPVKSETTQPVKSETTQPVKSETTQPVKSETTQPVKSETTPQVKSETTPQVKSKTTQPVKKGTTQPVKSETTQPVKSETTQPVKSETTQPVKSNTTPQVKSETTPQVKSETTPQVKSETTQPVKSETTQLVKSNTTPQVKSETTQPVKSETTQPVKSETTQPVKSETTPQVKSETTQPVKSETTQLVKSNTTSQGKSETTQPVKSETTQPVKRETTPPVKRETPPQSIPVEKKTDSERSLKEISDHKSDMETSLVEETEIMTGKWCTPDSTGKHRVGKGGDPRTEAEGVIPKGSEKEPDAGKRTYSETGPEQQAERLGSEKDQAAVTGRRTEPARSTKRKPGSETHESPQEMRNKRQRLCSENKDETMGEDKSEQTTTVSGPKQPNAPEDPDSENARLLSYIKSLIHKPWIIPNVGWQKRYKKAWRHICKERTRRREEASARKGTVPSSPPKYTQLSNYLKMKDREPVIGLSALVQCLSDQRLHIYQCKHCCLKIPAHGIVNHVTGDGHRMRSLEKEHPHLIQDWRSDLDPAEHTSKLREMAEQLEGGDGYGQLKVMQTEPIVSGTSEVQPSSTASATFIITTATPRTEDTHKTSAVTPQTEAVTPETYAVTPETYAVTPETYAVTPETYAVTPETYGVTPETYYAVTPETYYAVTPETYAVTPETYAVTPETYAVTPETYAVTPETSAVTPETSAVTPETYAVTPETYAVTPETDTVTPATYAVTPEIDGNIKLNTLSTPGTCCETTESTDLSKSTVTATSSSASGKVAATSNSPATNSIIGITAKTGEEKCKTTSNTTILDTTSTISIASATISQSSATISIYTEASSNTNPTINKTAAVCKAFETTVRMGTASKTTTTSNTVTASSETETTTSITGTSNTAAAPKTRTNSAVCQNTKGTTKKKQSRKSPPVVGVNRSEGEVAGLSANCRSGQENAHEPPNLVVRIPVFLGDDRNYHARAYPSPALAATGSEPPDTHALHLDPRPETSQNHEQAKRSSPKLQDTQRPPEYPERQHPKLQDSRRSPEYLERQHPKLQDTQRPPEYPERQHPKRQDTQRPPEYLERQHPKLQDTQRPPEYPERQHPKLQDTQRPPEYLERQHPKLQDSQRPPEYRERQHPKLQDTQRPPEYPERQHPKLQDSRRSPEYLERQHPKLQDTQRPPEFFQHSAPRELLSMSTGERVSDHSNLRKYLEVKGLTTQPIIGLARVWECRPLCVDLATFYLCESCCETIHLKNMCEHIVSRDHRSSYLSKYCPHFLHAVWDENLPPDMEEQLLTDIEWHVSLREDYDKDHAKVIFLDQDSYERVLTAPFSEALNMVQDLSPLRLDWQPPGQLNPVDPPPMAPESARTTDTNESTRNDSAAKSLPVKEKKECLHLCPVTVKQEVAEPEMEAQIQAQVTPVPEHPGVELNSREGGNLTACQPERDLSLTSVGGEAIQLTPDQLQAFQNSELRTANIRNSAITVTIKQEVAEPEVEAQTQAQVTPAPEHPGVCKREEEQRTVPGSSQNETQPARTREKGQRAAKDVQDYVSKKRRGAVVGLSAVIECSCEGQIPFYICVVCGSRIKPELMIHHIETLKHRKNYLSVRFPWYFKEEFLGLKQMEKSIELMNIAREVEQQNQDEPGTMQEVHLSLEDFKDIRAMTADKALSRLQAVCKDQNRTELVTCFTSKPEPVAVKQEVVEAVISYQEVEQPEPPQRALPSLSEVGQAVKHHSEEVSVSGSMEVNRTSTASSADECPPQAIRTATTVPQRSAGKRPFNPLQHSTLTPSNTHPKHAAEDDHGKSHSSYSDQAKRSRTCTTNSAELPQNGSGDHSKTRRSRSKHSSSRRETPRKSSTFNQLSSPLSNRSRTGRSPAEPTPASYTDECPPQAIKKATTIFQGISLNKSSSKSHPDTHPKPWQTSTASPSNTHPKHAAENYHRESQASYSDQAKHSRTCTTNSAELPQNGSGDHSKTRRSRSKHSPRRRETPRKSSAFKQPSSQLSNRSRSPAEPTPAAAAAEAASSVKSLAGPHSNTPQHKGPSLDKYTRSSPQTTSQPTTRQATPEPSSHPSNSVPALATPPKSPMANKGSHSNEETPSIVDSERFADVVTMVKENRFAMNVPPYQAIPEKGEGATVKTTTSYHKSKGRLDSKWGPFASEIPSCSVMTLGSLSNVLKRKLSPEAWNYDNRQFAPDPNSTLSTDMQFAPDPNSTLSTDKQTQGGYSGTGHLSTGTYPSPIQVQQTQGGYSGTGHLSTGTYPNPTQVQQTQGCYSGTGHLSTGTYPNPTQVQQTQGCYSGTGHLSTGTYPSPTQVQQTQGGYSGTGHLSTGTYLNATQVQQTTGVVGSYNVLQCTSGNGITPYTYNHPTATAPSPSYPLSAAGYNTTGSHWSNGHSQYTHNPSFTSGYLQPYSFMPVGGYTAPEYPPFFPNVVCSNQAYPQQGVAQGPLGMYSMEAATAQPQHHQGGLGWRQQ